MDSLFDFLKVVAIIVGILILILIILLSLPNSRLRDSIIKFYSIVSFVASIISVIYIISPIDAIPDLIPVAGQTDDIVALIVAIITAAGGYLSNKKIRDSKT